MKKRVLAAMLAGVMVLGLAGCGGSSDEKKEDIKTENTAKDEDKESDGDQFDDTTITIFAAKSLNGVVDELISMYNEEQPNVEIVTSYDSSGTLMEQIEHFDEKDYQKKCKDFCDMLGFYDDGHASGTVVDLILEKMNI